MSSFFTSDHHFGHRGILKHREDPPGCRWGSVVDMDDFLIERWNAVVRPGDTVYHLGDIFFCGQERAKEIRRRLNGNICLVLGNHDRTAPKIPECFGWIKDMYYLREGGRRIVLCHYAMRVWRNSVHGSWHLFGHSHGHMPGVGYSFDVGVDANNYQPVSFEEIVYRMTIQLGPGLEIDQHRRSVTEQEV